MEALNEFERTYLERAASHYPTLKSHLPYLRILDRETTGVGMFIHICYNPDDIKLVPIEPSEGRTISPNEIVNIENLQNELGNIIFIKDGRIDFIELVIYDEEWDGVIGAYSFTPRDTE